MALAPVLNSLSGEIAATADYFEFQRLAGRAPDLQLSMLGARIAGFANWLGDMLQVDVTDAPSGRTCAAASPALNLLEGMRTGLLKIGNQHFDFVGGRFVPSAGAAGSVRCATPAWLPNGSRRRRSRSRWKRSNPLRCRLAAAAGACAADRRLRLRDFADRSRTARPAPISTAACWPGWTRPRRMSPKPPASRCCGRAT